jgi:hypothetical protein
MDDVMRAITSSRAAGFPIGESDSNRAAQQDNGCADQADRSTRDVPTVRAHVACAGLVMRLDGLISLQPCG